MITNLSWKKNIFSSTYSIYSNGDLVGKMKDKTFSNTAEGILFGKKINFNTKGFFGQSSVIVDEDENKIIGKITYNNWKTKATLQIPKKLLKFEYDNIWNTRCSIFDSSGLMIKYSISSNKGTISANTEDASIILGGLFITNYYRQKYIAVIIATQIPIWAAILN